LKKQPVDLPSFQKALPVWLSGRARTVNIQAGFRASFDMGAGGTADIVVAASTFYRLWVNGQLVMHGPARSAHGYLRVDEVPLGGVLQDGVNVVSIEVAGYNCGNSSHVCRPSFLQAEVRVAGTAARWTGEEGGFEAYSLTSRHQKVVRFSCDRDFTEIYSLDNRNNLPRWHLPGSKLTKSETMEVVDHKCRFLPREAALPELERANPRARVQVARLVPQVHADGYSPPAKSFFADPSPGHEEWVSFPLSSIPDNPYYMLLEHELETVRSDRKTANLFPQLIRAGDFLQYDMERSLTGFISLRLLAKQDATVIIVFDEQRISKIQDAMPAWVSANVLKLEVKGSAKPYELVSFEPYAFQYIAVMVTEGETSLLDLHLREYAYPKCNNVIFSATDGRLVRIVEAGRESCRQHVLDVPMDGSRGASLVASYFLAPALQFYSGDMRPEHAHLANFAHSAGFPGHPKGMLPIAYPSECRAKLPTLGLWYAVELSEHIERLGKGSIAELRRTVLALLEHLKGHENAEGLLEDVGDAWWMWPDMGASAKGVQFPTNMLYARCLEVAAQLYDKPELGARATAARHAIVEHGFDGRLFADASTRDARGRLARAPHRSELCQHLAFLLGTVKAADRTFAPLAKAVIHEMGPLAEAPGAETSGFADPPPARHGAPLHEPLGRTVPLGRGYDYMARLLLLLRLREHARLVEECVNVFHAGAGAGAQDQGAPAIVGLAVLKAVMGVQRIDNKAMTVTLDFAPIPLRQGRLSIGTPAGRIVIEREYEEGGPFKVRYSVPGAYKVDLVPPTAWFQVHELREGADQP
jgi:alpha-L-rhamnosidase